MSDFLNSDPGEWTVTLTLDGGEEIECRVIAVFNSAVSGRDYIALLPLEGADANGEDVYLYRYCEDANGEPSLDNIEDDEEYEIAADAYDEYLDELDFEESASEEDFDE